MSDGEQIPKSADNARVVAATDAVVEENRSEKIIKAKELYSRGSRNFLVKSYSEAADELSQVCALYEELYGELSDEIGMPYLLYAKSLVALALDENKVIDVPDQENDDDDADNEDEEVVGEEEETEGNAEDKSTSSTNASAVQLYAIKETNDIFDQSDEADSTERGKTDGDGKIVKKATSETQTDKGTEQAHVSSTDDNADVKKNCTNTTRFVMDGEKPSTSNGLTAEHVEEEDEAASTLQLAWEILELAAKVFSRQGLSGLPNLAEVQTELANIEFENNILDAARDDYAKALKIYQQVPTNYRRAMAEIHYKIGLTYLMQQLNKEGAQSLKEACKLIDGEIVDIKNKLELNEKDKSNIQDMEETKQEIWSKISEIEETEAQNLAEVRAALDSYIKPISSEKADGASTSSAAIASQSATATSALTSAGIKSSSKPTDISHLIKRKKPEEPSSETEASCTAKRPAV